MAIYNSPPTDDGKGALAPAVTQTVDYVIACYIKWREDAASVRDAYGRWSAAPRGADATGLFSAYQAALDQEQSSAGSYQLGVARLDTLSRSSAAP